MQKILIVVDMQVDFINGALGTREAEAILPRVREIIESFDGKIYFTRDTHEENYLSTKEGKNLPVPHCINGTKGWQIDASLLPYAKNVINKPTFGSVALANMLLEENAKEEIEEITLIGLCTDICVISNAMLLKTHLTEAEIIVDASACAGVTPKSHKNALEAMKMCQIRVINE